MNGGAVMKIDRQETGAAAKGPRRRTNSTFESYQRLIAVRGCESFAGLQLANRLLDQILSRHLVATEYVASSAHLAERRLERAYRLIYLRIAALRHRAGGERNQPDRKHGGG